jgi:DNA-binding IscR family transcriptional regulator
MTTQQQQALQALWDLASSVATPEQVKQVAEQFDIEPWQLEGFYFDSIEAWGDE